MEAPKLTVQEMTEFRQVDNELLLPRFGHMYRRHATTGLGYLALGDFRYPACKQGSSIENAFLTKAYESDIYGDFYHVPDTAMSFKTFLETTLKGPERTDQKEKKLQSKFASIGAVLKTIFETDSAVPQSLTHHQVLVQNQGRGVWFLPPIKLKRKQKSGGLELNRLGFSMLLTILAEEELHGYRAEIMKGYDSFVPKKMKELKVKSSRASNQAL